MVDFSQPMEPYPGLEQCAQIIDLPRNRLRLFYYAAGVPWQPAALLLHGLGDEADTWRFLIEPLSQRWRVIAPDLPGFGRSEKPQRAYTLEFLQGCLFELSGGPLNPPGFPGRAFAWRYAGARHGAGSARAG